jgi:phage-related protein
VTYSIIYYSDQVQEDVLALPDTLQARYIGLTARMMYCLMIERQILVLHVFVKKTQKTPPRELGIARQRMKEFKK